MSVPALVVLLLTLPLAVSVTIAMVSFVGNVRAQSAPILAARSGAVYGEGQGRLAAVAGRISPVPPRALVLGQVHRGPGGDLRGPISGLPCAWYQLEVVPLRGLSAGAGFGYVPRRDSLVLETPEGRVVVGVELLRRPVGGGGGGLVPYPGDETVSRVASRAEVRALLTQSPLRGFRWVGRCSPEFRVRERIVAPGATVAVAGRLRVHAEGVELRSPGRWLAPGPDGALPDLPRSALPLRLLAVVSMGFPVVAWSLPVVAAEHLRR